MTDFETAAIPQPCNCEQATKAERQLRAAREALDAIKRCLESDMGPGTKLAWVGSIVALAEANAARNT